MKWHVPTAASITEVIPLLKAVVSNTISDLTATLTDLSTTATNGTSGGASGTASAKDSTDDLSQLGSVALGSPMAVTGTVTPVPGGFCFLLQSEVFWEDLIFLLLIIWI